MATLRFFRFQGPMNMDSPRIKYARVCVSSMFPILDFLVWISRRTDFLSLHLSNFACKQGALQIQRKVCISVRPIKSELEVTLMKNISNTIEEPNIGWKREKQGWYISNRVKRGDNYDHWFNWIQITILEYANFILHAILSVEKTQITHSAFSSNFKMETKLFRSEFPTFNHQLKVTTDKIMAMILNDTGTINVVTKCVKGNLPFFSGWKPRIEVARIFWFRTETVKLPFLLPRARVW